MPPKPENLFIRSCSTGNAEVVKSLLNNGLPSDTRDQYGLTGLIWAGRKGQIEIAKLLLDAGADLEAKDRTGRTVLFHAVAFKRYEFVEFLFKRGARHDVVDMHNWSPFDVATVPRNDKMIELFVRQGAARKSTEAPVPSELKKWNKFGSGGALGGPDNPVEVERIHMQLNRLFHKWTGNYTRAVEGFYFPKFVDGSLIRHTEEMNILGAQPAKRKRNWLEVRIGVPESWWREPETTYKRRLTDAIEEGLHSMITLLQRNKHEIDAVLLLADWENVKREFLETLAPPFAAEKQRVTLMAAVQQAVQAVEERKASVTSTRSSKTRRKARTKK